MSIVFSFNVLTGLREIYIHQLYIRLPHITRSSMLSDSYKVVSSIYRVNLNSKLLSILHRRVSE